MKVVAACLGLAVAAPDFGTDCLCDQPIASYRVENLTRLFKRRAPVTQRAHNCHRSQPVTRHCRADAGKECRLLHNGLEPLAERKKRCAAIGDGTHARDSLLHAQGLADWAPSSLSQCNLLLFVPHHLLANEV